MGRATTGRRRLPTKLGLFHQGAREQGLDTDRPDGIEAVLREGAGALIVVLQVPDSTIGENFGLALIRMIIKRKTTFLLLKFAEQVSFKPLECCFLVVAWLGTARVCSKTEGLDFNDDSSTRAIEASISTACPVDDAQAVILVFCAINSLN